MRAISTYAKEAAAEEQARRHSEADLASMVGATPGNAYLVKPDDEDDFVMVVTGVSHANDDAYIDAENVWRRPMGVTEDEFAEGVIVHAEFYEIRSIQNGAFVTHDDPFEEPNLYKNALKKFPRKPLETGAKENTYALPSLF